MKTYERELLAGIIAEKTLSLDYCEKKLSRAIAAYMMSVNSTDDLESVMRDTIIKRAERGVVEVVAYRSHPLSELTRKDIDSITRKIYPNADKVIIKEELRPDLIGGVELNFPDKSVNLSIRNKLNNFRQLTFNK